MFKFSNTPLGRFRLVAIAEGISYVLLIFIAMPLKYLAGQEIYVKYTGWVHGLLFILYLLALVSVKFDRNWSFVKSMKAFIISLIPVAAFFFDKSLRNEEKEITEEKIVIGN
ncbi:MAG: DUF3817 domain-containing protein [Ginsengibacter sp.]